MFTFFRCGNPRNPTIIQNKPINTKTQIQIFSILNQNPAFMLSVCIQSCSELYKILCCEVYDSNFFCKTHTKVYSENSLMCRKVYFQDRVMSFSLFFSNYYLQGESRSPETESQKQNWSDVKSKVEF